MPSFPVGYTPPTTWQGKQIGLFQWTTFNRIDNFGQIDPQGNYWKPDSNILTPPGYPITSLGSGTVTSVQDTNWGQRVVTIKLDTPLNSLATHTFYEHLGDSTVNEGQHVLSGQLIGHASTNPTVPNVGFGLYSGDVYGSGQDWNTLQQDLAPGGAGLLNPTNLLNQYKTLGGDTSPTGISGGLNAGQGVNAGLCDTPFVGGLICWLQSNIASWAEHVAFFLIGLVLIIIGFVILIHPNPQELLRASEVAAA